MPKNKNSPNAFYYFMIDWKKQEEFKGQTFPRGLKDVQANPNCNEAWKNLPVETKILYKEKEKRNRSQMKINKKTCLGESIEEVVKSQLSDIEFMDNMKRSISTTIVQAARSKAIEILKFHVIHVNYLYSRVCDNNEIVYYPAEIGIAEFSLKNGITRTYHKIVNSKVKIGYASAAIEHSKNTHQIPRDYGESNYGTIYEEICKFLEPSRCDGKLPPLYTLYHKEDVKCSVICGLELFENSCENIQENLIIHSFEELFINLRNINIKDDDVIQFDDVIVSIKLAEDPYDYRKNIACEFHQISGGENHCSKSIIQRWIFILCSFTCSLFNIDLIPGFHTPAENKNIEDNFQLDYSFGRMSLTRNEHYENQPKHASERTWNDEQKRRSEAMARPLQIVDYSEINNTSQNKTAPLQRPLQPLCTKPITSYTNDDNDCSEITYHDDFPSIGRGFRIRSQRGNARRN